MMGPKGYMIACFFEHNQTHRNAKKTNKISWSFDFDVETPFVNYKLYKHPWSCWQWICL
jgi:hypothetical protein